MYCLVEEKHQFEYLLNNINSEECFINIITINDFYHPKLTTPSLVYFKPKGDKGYMLCIDHSETFSLDFKDVISLLNKYKFIYCLDKKFHLYFLPANLGLIDINFNLSKPINDSEYNTIAHNILYNKVGNRNDVDKLVPVAKHYEKWETIHNELEHSFTQQNNEYFNKLTNIFYLIESVGITVDKRLFFKSHPPAIEDRSFKYNKIFTYYNLYNTTTRPTNSFNGINFSTLSKDTRNGIIAANDFLIEIDFKEYHPRLIADQIGYEVDISIYEDIAVKLEITRDEAKKKTFQHLYGTNEQIDLDFFKQINEFKHKKFKEYQQLGYLELFGAKRIQIDDPNENKLLSYLIQSLETYNNVEVLSKILPLLQNINTKIIHYLYDSMLLDVAKDDEKTLKKIIKIASSGGFPIKISHGKNYRDMEELIFISNEVI